MLGSILDVSELRVTARTRASMDAFVEALAPSCAFPLRAEPDNRRAVEGAGLVVTLTDAPTPLVLPGLLAPGAVVCSMGGKNEVDIGVLRESQRLVVDDPDFASEVGDGGAWIAQGHFTRESFAARIDALAHEVAAGSRPGRTTPGERIVAIVQGMAIGDIAFSAFALQEAERQGRGVVVELP
jgi:ornithine cyclodeaminase